MKYKLKWMLLIAWMILIFLFSSQTGQESSESSGLIEQVLTLFPIIPNSIFGLELQFIIRKGAHFTEYMILYLLIFNILREHLTFNRCLGYSLVGVFLYACSDEIHQAFVPERACLFTDVLIDTSGGLLGLYLMKLKHKFIQDKFVLSSSNE